MHTAGPSRAHRIRREIQKRGGKASLASIQVCTAQADARMLWANHLLLRVGISLSKKMDDMWSRILESASISTQRRSRHNTTRLRLR